jgi:hypothetical protein
MKITLFSLATFALIASTVALPNRRDISINIFDVDNVHAQRQSVASGTLNCQTIHVVHFRDFTAMHRSKFAYFPSPSSGTISWNLSFEGVWNW